MGVGFQLNMIDGETSLSAGFPGDAEERAVPRDKYFCSLFVCADMPRALFRVGLRQRIKIARYIWERLRVRTSRLCFAEKTARRYPDARLVTRMTTRGESEAS